MPAVKGLTIDELASFCKRKGFVYPSGEVYGGLAGFWDFGPLGSEVIANLKRAWWQYHVHMRDDVVGIDGSIITNPNIWSASGHVAHFVDYIIKEKKSGQVFKVDAHEVKQYEKNNAYIVEGAFNPMFTTHVGPNSSKGTVAYLRPETAQSIFANFKLVYDHSRLKLPCGIAQIGKAFRNEIAPREFLFRSREFEQMELEYFIAPGMECPFMDEIGDVELALYTEEMQIKEQKEKVMPLYEAWKKGVIKSDWHVYWLAKEFQWFLSLGAKPQRFRARQHTKEEKSHYAVDTWDLEYQFPMGWRELQGIANRGAFDLTQHQEHSKESFAVLVDEASGKKVVPEVVCEPSLGVGRAFIVFMLDAYEHDAQRDNIILHLHPMLAPYKAAVFPLISKGEQLKLAQKVHRDLASEFSILFDDSGSIGRRYARNDEMGTPYCIAIDDDSVTKKTVTIRDRDSTKQIRVKIDELHSILRDLIRGNIVFEKAGKLVETRTK
jgi:glycyl-tRNA synthetase